MLAGGRVRTLRMRSWVMFGSSFLDRPIESAVDAKVRTVLALVGVALTWPAPYTASVAEVAGSGDTSLFLWSGGPVRHGIYVSSIVVELHGSRVRCVVTSKFSVMRLRLHANYPRYEVDKRGCCCIEEDMSYDGFIGGKFVFVVVCQRIL
jgi:hypothetical protein